jgi:protein involved in polysaccharide export with SLBB domain
LGRCMYICGMRRYCIPFILCLLTLPLTLLGQQIPNNIDFSKVNVDNLTDQQVQQLWAKAQAGGLSVDDVCQQAKTKGMPDDQVEKLRQRLTQVSQQSPQVDSTASNNNNPQGARTYKKSRQSVADSLNTLDEIKEIEFRRKIFGASLFSNANLTFEPDLTIPTPGNYVIGAGDQLILNVYGYSEKNSKLTVSPDGSVDIENVGPVQVSGLTIDEARVKITSKLKSIYSGITNGSTQVQLTLGNIRSIRVIVTGEVVRPGSYTLPSLATVANALYASGGPDVNGSFRDIQVVRDGKTLVHFDLYDFLVRGSLENNVLLRDQDILRVNPYEIRVELKGEVKHPAIFESKPGEKLGDIIGYAGGFTSKAYVGFIRAERMNGREKVMLTIPSDSTGRFTLVSGDVFSVDSVLDRFINRVTLTGSVFHPGSFALDSGMTLKDLIKEADGVKEDAYLPRGLIKRLNPDFSPIVVNFNLQDVLTGKTIVPLHREDSVFVFSKFKIREHFYIIVRGEVNHPDTLPYADSMHLGDAILLAGGLRDAASLQQIEIARRIRSQFFDPLDTNLAVVRRFSIQNDLKEDPEADTFAIQPFDDIMVRHSPGYHEQAVVKVEGEVLYPGSYVIDTRYERMSDLIRKAGGITPTALASGAELLRASRLLGPNSQFEKNKLDVFAAANRSDDSLEIRKIKSNMDSSMQLVDVHLDRALANPGSKYDLYLERGDDLRIPKELETVSLYGEVFYPKLVRYDTRLRFKDFIRQGGGFTVSALRRGSYIVYPNGEVASTRKFLVFNRFPKVKAGSEIFIPAKKERKGLDTQALVSIVGGMAALLAVLVAVLKI